MSFAQAQWLSWHFLIGRVVTEGSLLARVFAVRHGIGALLGAIAGWVPAVEGLHAYAPIARHGECGFLCMNMLSAGFWGAVAAATGAFVWLVTVLAIRALRMEAEQASGD
jgi:hypothetical protein